jgi:tetratricopeptide (TPR) repeat protein
MSSNQRSLRPKRRPGNLETKPRLNEAALRRFNARKTWIFGLALLLATLAAYQPAWRGGMLWDDDFHLTSPSLSSWHGLYRIWFDPGATLQYYPLLHTVFWVEHHLWGDATLGYHLVNILMHVTAAVLFSLILSRLGIPGAYLASAIFALHPIQVESVAWMTELKNTLSAVFYLGAALLYLRFDETRKTRWYASALGAFVLALLTKTVTGTLPGALLVMFWWKRGRLSWKRDATPLVPFFVLGAGFGMLTARWELEFNNCVGADFEFTLVERALIAGRAVWFLLGKLFWPANLTFIYPRWQINAGVWWQYLFPIGGAAFLASLWAMRRRFRGPLAAMLFFCGTLFPVLGFFNLYTFRFSLVANHYQYLAGAGIIVLASAGAVLLKRRLAKRFLWTGYVLVSVVLATLGGLTWRESRQYADAETLYRTTLSRNPSCWLALNNLGNLKLETSPDEAVALFKEALRLKPDLAEAHGNLGSALQKMGRLEESITECRLALKIDPAIPGARHALARALRDQGRNQEAVTQYKEVLRLKPDSAEVHNELGDALQDLRSLEEAKAHYEEALRIEPDFVEAHNNLGNALRKLGRAQAAIDQYREALRLKPDYANAHYNLGNILQEMGRLDEAVAQYGEALRSIADKASVHNNLGTTLEAMGKVEDAVWQYREAVRVKPDYANAHFNLGNILQKMGRSDDAASQYREVLRLNPDDAEAHNNLGVALIGLGRPELALEHFKEALRIKPDYADARANVSKITAGLKIRREPSL